MFLCFVQSKIYFKGCAKLLEFYFYLYIFFYLYFYCNTQEALIYISYLFYKMYFSPYLHYNNTRMMQ